MFDVQSDIANDGKVDVVRNLFTIKPENISTLYIDSSDDKSLKSIADSLEKSDTREKNRHVRQAYFEGFNKIISRIQGVCSVYY